MSSKAAMMLVATALAVGAAAFTPTTSKFGDQTGFTLVNFPCQFERAPDLCQADAKTGKVVGKTLYRGGRKILRLGKPST